MNIFKNFKKKRDFFEIEELTYDDHVRVSMNVSNDVLEIMGQIVKEALGNLKEKEAEDKDFEMYGKYASPEETE